jgi:hypothetical protein
MKKSQELKLNDVVITLAAGMSLVLAKLYPGFITPLAGVLTLLGIRLHLLPDPFSSPMLPGLVASLSVNCCLFVLISYCTKPQPLERDRKSTRLNSSH